MAFVSPAALFGMSTQNSVASYFRRYWCFVIGLPPSPGVVQLSVTLPSPPGTTVTSVGVSGVLASWACAGADMASSAEKASTRTASDSRPAAKRAAMARGNRSRPRQSRRRSVLLSGWEVPAGRASAGAAEAGESDQEEAPRRTRGAVIGSARLGSARLGSARLGSARLGSARLGSARLGSARLEMTIPKTLKNVKTLPELFAICGICIGSLLVMVSSSPASFPVSTGRPIPPASIYKNENTLFL